MRDSVIRHVGNQPSWCQRLINFVEILIYYGNYQIALHLSRVESDSESYEYYSLVGNKTQAAHITIYKIREHERMFF